MQQDDRYGQDAGELEEAAALEVGALEEADDALIELPLSEVVVDTRWNCRGAPSEEEIAKAVEMFAQEPMLHPPVVAPVGEGRHQLVSGFLRFEVLRRQGHEAGVFRLVRGSELDLQLWNLSENTARRSLKNHELVERVWMLHGRGVPKARLAQACGFGVRYLNRLLFIRRRAHPELYTLFRQEHPGLTVARMARLVSHPPEEQMQEFRRSEAHLERAMVIEQGYSETLEDEPQSDGVGVDGVGVDGVGVAATERAPVGTGHRSRRRRLPSRSHVLRLLRMHRHASSLHPEYRRAAVAVLEHLLTGEPLPERLTAPSDSAE